MTLWSLTIASLMAGTLLIHRNRHSIIFVLTRSTAMSSKIHWKRLSWSRSLANFLADYRAIYLKEALTLVLVCLIRAILRTKRMDGRGQRQRRLTDRWANSEHNHIHTYVPWQSTDSFGWVVRGDYTRVPVSNPGREHGFYPQDIITKGEVWLIMVMASGRYSTLQSWK